VSSVVVVGVEWYGAPQVSGSTGMQLQVSHLFFIYSFIFLPEISGSYIP
jgi:hypothetical protein